MSSALSDDGSRIISESVHIHENLSVIRHDSQESLDRFYEIDETLAIILENDYLRVALQFPDDLLSDAVAVSYRLREKWNQVRGGQKSVSKKITPVKSTVNVGDIEEIGINEDVHQVHHAPEPALTTESTSLKLYILGDTSYGSCCVDEVASQHVDAQFIIHYGNACLQKVQRTPVYHVFGTNNDLDLESCLNALDQYAQQTLGKYVVVLYHLSYCDAVKQLKEAFEQRENNIARVSFATVDLTRVIQNVPKSVINQEQESSKVVVHDIGSLQFRLPRDETDYKFFYIGEDSPSLTHIMMDNNNKQFARFSIASNRFDDGSSESSKISRMLKRRYYLVHLTREANVIGILVATTSAGNYLQMIERVKRLITDAGKKYYVFFVGKLNVPKLANFAEIDLYVLISCPQNSLIDSKEFLKPIVTPFELQMGLLRKDREWTGEYITDFNKLLISSGNDSEQEPLNDDDYDYSFITGRMKKFSRPNRALSENEQTVDQNALVSVDSSNRQLLLAEMTPAMNFLQTRTYRGLEQTEEETPVGVIVEGRSGIARGYTHESEILNQK